MVNSKRIYVEQVENGGFVIYEAMSDHRCSSRTLGAFSKIEEMLIFIEDYFGKDNGVKVILNEDHL